MRTRARAQQRKRADQTLSETHAQTRAQTQTRAPEHAATQTHIRIRRSRRRLADSIPCLLYTSPSPRD
eukprot:13427581-Alexandrium_andersonii.AAC.1